MRRRTGKAVLLLVFFLAASAVLRSRDVTVTAQEETSDFGTGGGAENGEADSIGAEEQEGLTLTEEERDERQKKRNPPFWKHLTLMRWRTVLPSCSRNRRRPFQRSSSC